MPRRQTVRSSAPRRRSRCSAQLESRRWMAHRPFPNLHVSAIRSLPTSSRCCATGDRHPSSFASSCASSRWLLGYEAMARPRAGRGPGRDAAGADGGRGARAEGRARSRAARGARHGRRHAGADAHRAGLAHRPLPRRANAEAGGVLQQAARRGDGAGLPDPGSDAGHRRLVGRDRGHPQGLGRGAHQAGESHRGSRRHRDPLGGASGRATSTSAPWTATSTSVATSCPAWETRETGSSAPSRGPAPSPATGRTRPPRSSAGCSAPSPTTEGIPRGTTKRPEGTASGPLM